MRLNVRALTLAAAVLWGLAILLTGLVNMAWPSYGIGFLAVLASIYPGYDASGTFFDLLTGILYALLDGAVFGLIFGWLYNRFLGQGTIEGRVEASP